MTIKGMYSSDAAYYRACARAAATQSNLSPGAVTVLENFANSFANSEEPIAIAKEEPKFDGNCRTCWKPLAGTKRSEEVTECEECASL